MTGRKVSHATRPLSVIAMVMLGALILAGLAGCGSDPTPTAESPATQAPAPTDTTAPTDTALPSATFTASPSPTPTPAAAIDDSWDKVVAAGKIIAGTAADYPPFEFLTPNGELDGFDIVLMDEIAEQLDLEVEFVDMAFEGLPDALELGDVDLAIAALSVTTEREALFDFSSIYYVGEDAFLTRAGESIDIDEIDDLSQYRVGVQRSTVHEEWLRDVLVGTGLLPSDNLFVYANAGDLTRDLTMNRLDLALMDIQPALVAVNEGEFRLAGRGLNQMYLAIALPKGADALTEQINQALKTLHDNGTIANLTRLYLGQEAPLPTPTPRPTNTPGPTATPPPPPACVDGMQFLQHPPGDPHNGQVSPGQAFTKVWRVKNSGTCTWNSNYRVVHVSGNKLGAGPTRITRAVAPGETYDIAVGMVAPQNPGTYQGRWHMENGKGKGFGARLPVKITVPARPTAPPPPTQTPVPGIQFNVDRDQITGGECVWFSWRVSNVQAVYFYAEGQRWQDGGVTGEGSRQECPPSTTTYYLRVVKSDGSVETRQITIWVSAAVGKPVIEFFQVDPAGPINLGQCVTVRWKVSGAIDVVRIFVNDQRVWDRAPIEGNYQHCPDRSGTFGYAMSANGPGGRSERNQRVQVQ